MRSFLLIVRELKLVIRWFFIPYVTRIAPLDRLESSDKDKVAAIRDMEHRTRNLDFLLVKGKELAELDLVKWLTRRPKRLVDL